MTLAAQLQTRGRECQHSSHTLDLASECRAEAAAGRRRRCAAPATLAYSRSKSSVTLGPRQRQARLAVMLEVRAALLLLHPSLLLGGAPVVRGLLRLHASDVAGVWVVPWA